MIRPTLTACLAVVLHAATAGAAEGDPKRGAEVYRACVSCHALEPGLHLSGPSLAGVWGRQAGRSEEHTSELQSLMPSSYAVFCLKKQKSTHSAVKKQTTNYETQRDKK